MKPLRPLTLDFDPIEHAMRDVCRLSNDYYLHRTTGKVIGLSRTLIKYLAGETQAEREALLHDWDARMIPLARQIVVSGSTEYVRIPEAFGRPEHLWMVKFTDDIHTAKLKHRLATALRGRGAAKRFKEILAEHPDDVRRWTMYRVRCWQEKIEEWLESIGILAVDQNPRKPRTSAR